MSDQLISQLIKPDSGCLVCGGLGKMDFKGKRVTCECIIRKKAKQYLGPLYANVAYSSILKFDERNLNMRFLRFDICSAEHFKSIVKSFLLYNNMKLSHKHIMPYQIIQSYFEDTFFKLLNELSEIDFLTIYFINDPTNKLYGELIEIILDKRILFNKLTWLFFKDSFEKNWFKEKYSSSLLSYLKENFKRPKGVKDYTFEKGGNE